MRRPIHAELGGHNVPEGRNVFSNSTVAIRVTTSHRCGPVAGRLGSLTHGAFGRGQPGGPEVFGYESRVDVLQVGDGSDLHDLGAETEVWLVAMVAVVKPFGRSEQSGGGGVSTQGNISLRLF